MRHLPTLLTVVAIGIVGACQTTDSPEQKYQTYKVASRDLIRTIEANGSVEMENRVDVHAPVGGRIERVLVKEGDYVRKGQKLATMSSNTRATLVEMAGDKGKEEQKYWEKQILPTSIFAPVSGRVLTIRAEAGDKIKGSVINLSTGMLIRAHIDETDLPNIHVNQPVKVTFDISETHSIMGTVTEIAQNSSTVNNVNVYRIEVVWPDEEAKKLPFQIRFGMSVTLFLEVEKRAQVPALPVAVANGRTNTQIELLNGELQPITLKVGDVYGDWIEVQSGAKVGQAVKVPAFENPAEKMRKIPFVSDKK